MGVDTAGGRRWAPLARRDDVSAGVGSSRTIGGYESSSPSFAASTRHRRSAASAVGGERGEDQPPGESDGRRRGGGGVRRWGTRTVAGCEASSSATRGEETGRIEGGKRHRGRVSHAAEARQRSAKRGNLLRGADDRHRTVWRLNKMVLEAGSVEAVLDIVDAHAEAFDFVHVSAAVNKLQKIAAGSRARSAGELRSDRGGRLALLMRLVKYHHKMFGHQAVANVLHGLAFLEADLGLTGLVDEELGVQLARVLEREATGRRMSAQGVCNTLIALAKLRSVYANMQTPSWRALANSVEPVAADMTAQGVSTSLNALCRLKPVEAAMSRGGWASLVRGVVRTAPEMDANHLSMTMRALTKLSPLRETMAPESWSTLVQSVESATPMMSAPSVAMTLSAIGEMKGVAAVHVTPAGWRAFAEKVNRLAPAMSSLDVATTLEALATLPEAVDATAKELDTAGWTALASAVHATAADMNGKGVAVTLGAYERLPEEAAARLSGATRRRLEDAVARESSRMNQRGRERTARACLKLGLKVSTERIHGAGRDRDARARLPDDGDDESDESSSGEGRGVGSHFHKRRASPMLKRPARRERS